MGLNWGGVTIRNNINPKSCIIRINKFGPLNLNHCKTIKKVNNNATYKNLINYMVRDNNLFIVHYLALLNQQ